MGESIGGAERQNGEGDGRAGQSLNDIVDRAIATAGKHGVTAGRHRAAGVVGRFLAGAANRKFGADASRLDDANGMVQFPVAPRAARVGIEQNGGFVHASASCCFEFNARPTPTWLAGGCFRDQICTMLARKVLGRFLFIAIAVRLVHFRRNSVCVSRSF